MQDTVYNALTIQIRLGEIRLVRIMFAANELVYRVAVDTDIHGYICSSISNCHLYSSRDVLRNFWQMLLMTIRFISA